jgi:dTDP-4-dehydrorhamnose reductase
MVEKKLSGLYHTVSREALSKFEFGKKIARQFSLDEHLITPVSVTEGGLAARRSPNLNLRVDKLEKALGRSLPGVDLGISGFHRQYLLRFPQRLRSFTDHGAINQAGGSAA